MIAKLQLSFFAVATGWLVATLTVGEYGLPYAVTFLIVSGLACAGIWLFLKRMKGHSMNDENELDAKHEDHLMMLPLDQAERRAWEFLKDESLFECIVKRLSPEESVSMQQNQLPHGLEKLFSKYETVRSKFGDGVLSECLVGPSAFKDGCLRVGESTEHSELVVRPRDEKLYELGEGEKLSHPYPSVFHWIVIEEAEVRAAQSNK